MCQGLVVLRRLWGGRLSRSRVDGGLALSPSEGVLETRIHEERIGRADRDEEEEEVGGRVSEVRRR